MKNKIIAFIVLTFLTAATAFGKGKENNDTISVIRAFIDLPAESLDLLPRSSRMDMVDYYLADSTYMATNNLKGKSELKKMTDNFLEVQVTPVSTLQFKILKTKEGKDIVMTVLTTGAEGETRESDISFFDAGLRQLPTEKYFKSPALAEFFDTKGYKTGMKEIAAMIPFYTVLLEASPDNSEITGSLTLGDILTLEDQKLVELLLKPQITFVWDGKNYKIQSNKK